MALAYLYDPLKQWQDLRGVNNVAGWLEVFISGTDEHAVAYSDFNGTLLPDRIGIDNDGRAVVIVDSEKAYRVEVHTANGDLLFTQYPVWTQVSGGGVIGAFVDIESSNGSLDVQKTVVGATTIYDLSVATDSTEGLDWIRTNGYTTVDGKLVPTYQDGTMEVGEYGIRLHGWRYYHVTARLVASVTAMPYYNEFTVTFSGKKAMGGTESYVTRNFVADCSTQLTQQYEVSFDVMPNNGDAELYATVSGLLMGVSVGLLDIEVHRVYSGIPDIPDGMATREWVNGNFQPTLSVGDGLELSGSFLSVDYSDVQEKLTAGDNITIENNVISATVPEFAEADWDATSGQPGYIHNKPDLSQYATEAELADKQDVLTAGDSISIENNVISAIIPEYADADWIAASGEPGYIHNKPTFIPGDNIWINQGPYAITIGEVITPKNADWDATSGIAEILNKPNLATVATTGNYTDLINKPNIPAPQVNSDWDATSGISQILNKPTEKTLVAGENITITDSNYTVTISAAGSSGADWDAASGQPGYIANKPDLGLFEARYGQTTYAEIMDAINERKIVFCPGQGVDSVFRMGTLTNFYNNPGSEYVEFEFYKSKTGTGVNDTVVIYRVDGNDNWTIDERDVKAGNISYPVTDVTVNGSSVVSSGVAAVTVPEQVNSDWDATSGISQILNRPDMVSLVAGENITITKDGSTLTISGEAGGGADWDAASGEPGYIAHKPDLSIYAETANLATVATTGDYDDLTNKPSIPAAQVNSDWDATSGISQILNKPEETTLTAGENITIAESGSTLTISATSSSQVNADWDAVSGAAEILNKPTIPDPLPSTTGHTGDVLTVDNNGDPAWETPSAGGVTDVEVNGSSVVSGGVASITVPAAQVQTDWDATSGIASIANKPSNVSVEAGTGILITSPTSSTVRIACDETVLWSDASGKTPATSGDFPITLSEAISNFDTVKFYWQTFNDSYQNHTVSEKMTDLSTFVLEGYIYNSSNDNGYSILWALSVSGTSLSHVACKYNNWTNNTVSGGGNFVRLYKVVGINRIV